MPRHQLIYCAEYHCLFDGVSISKNMSGHNDDFCAICEDICANYLFLWAEGEHPIYFLNTLWKTLVEEKFKCSEICSTVKSY